MRYVLVACVAILLGLWLGWTIRSASSGEPARSEATPSELKAPEPSSPSREIAPVTSSTESPPSPRDEAGLISAELRRYALDEIAAGWQEKRKDPIPEPLRDVGFQEFEGIVRRTPREIGRRLAGHQDDLDALASNDILTILRALDRGSLGPQLELIRDADRFRSFFRCSGGGTVDGLAAFHANEDLHVDSQTTLDFAVGVHSAYSGWLSHMKPLPNCITVAGAGMDRTLLVMGDLSTNGVVDRFSIRDCTVYTNDRYLFDLRREPAVLTFDHVRFCGFDMGAGSSCLLGTRATAVLATDCRFEGGYGHNPGSGTLFDVRTDALLARFERCSFSHMAWQSGWIRPGATLIFAHCTFEDVFGSKRSIQSDRPGIVFDGCTVIPADPPDGRPAALDLNELFPDWRARDGR